MRLSTAASAALAPIVSYVVVLISTALASVMMQGMAPADAVYKMMLILLKSVSLFHLLMFGIAAIPAVFVPAMLGLRSRGPVSRAARAAGWIGSVLLLSLFPTALCIMTFRTVLGILLTGVSAGGAAVLVIYLINRGEASDANARPAQDHAARAWAPAATQRSFGRRGG